MEDVDNETPAAARSARGRTPGSKFGGPKVRTRGSSANKGRSTKKQPRQESTASAEADSAGETVTTAASPSGSLQGKEGGKDKRTSRQNRIAQQRAREQHTGTSNTHIPALCFSFYII